MSTETVYFVTGTNRGIGLGLVKGLVARPNTTVYAGVREPSRASAELQEVAAKSKNLVIVKLESTNPTDAVKAIETIKEKSGKLDVVIANAAIAQPIPSLEAMPIEAISEHYEVNVVGPVALFKAALPLLRKSGNPKFIGVSTAAASISDMPFPTNAYGASKAALNYFLKDAHIEHHEKDGITVYPVSPGLVETDMSAPFLPTVTQAGLIPITVNQSASDLLKLVDSDDKSLSGRFWSHTGEEIAF